MIAKHLDGLLFYYCAGCGYGHSVPVDGSGGEGRNWKWNGSEERPTLTPSVRHFTKLGTTCHYFITEGQIDYCNDSAVHRLRGKHPMAHFPEGYGIGDWRAPAP